MICRIVVTLAIVCTAGIVDTRATGNPHGNDPVLVENVRDTLVKYARQFIGSPYRYGGVSPKGFDCSGFTCYVMNNFAYSLPHTSGGQSRLGKTIKFSETKPGDLLFFGHGKHIQHVAIVVSNDDEGLQMIHSSSTYGVRIEDPKKSDYWRKRIMFAVDLSSL